jgi:chitinase
MVWSFFSYKFRKTFFVSHQLEPAVVCYYTNWAQYRNGPGRFYPENIDPNLCTHIIYAFAQLNNGVIAAYEWNDESTQWSTGMYARMMNLRKASRPKILLALGGWNHGSGKFSDMVRNATKRATFITTTIIFLQKHKFDGLDLDWVKMKRVKKKIFLK